MFEEQVEEKEAQRVTQDVKVKQEITETQNPRVERIQDGKTIHCKEVMECLG